MGEFGEYSMPEPEAPTEVPDIEPVADLPEEAPADVSNVEAAADLPEESPAYNEPSFDTGEATGELPEEAIVEVEPSIDPYEAAVDLPEEAPADSGSSFYSAEPSPELPEEALADFDLSSDSAGLAAETISETEATPEPAMDMLPTDAQYEDLSVSSDGWEPLLDSTAVSGDAFSNGGGANVEQTEYFHGVENSKVEQSIDGHNPSWDAPPDGIAVEEIPHDLEPSPEPVIESIPIEKNIPPGGSKQERITSPENQFETEPIQYVEPVADLLRESQEPHAEPLQETNEVESVETPSEWGRGTMKDVEDNYAAEEIEAESSVDGNNTSSDGPADETDAEAADAPQDALPDEAAADAEDPASASDAGSRAPINQNYAGQNYDLQQAVNKKVDQSDFLSFDGNKVNLDAAELNKLLDNQMIAEKYPDGVHFDLEGYPDFSPYSIAEVKPDGLTGEASDFTKANEAAGLPEKPEGYTWHHHQDGKTLLLIPTDLHGAVRHTGGASKLRHANAQGIEWTS